MAENQIELLHEFRETGHNGFYETDKYYTLVVGQEGYMAVATLEVRIDRREGTGPTSTEVKRHKIAVKDLVRLVQEHGTRVD